MDPAKLKVVDLRSELAQRGLDTKGNKAALVKRLKDALEEELKQELPDTSIADTSTEDLDSSVAEETPKTQVENEENTVIEEEEPNEKSLQKEKAPEEPTQTVQSEIPETVTSEKSQVDDTSEVISQSETKKPESDESNLTVSDAPMEEPKEISANGEVEPKEEVQEAEQPKEETENQGENKEEAVRPSEAETKGEKRKRSSASPERQQRRRSKSPIREDEPPIDKDKVQLSWYDSDLHLQVDKESFLSAKPLTEGAFGFAWAGARATHGVASGKVCYEVKITEELKWDDFSKDDRRNKSRNRYRSDHRKRDKDKRDDRKSRDKNDRKTDKKESPSKNDKTQPQEEESEPKVEPAEEEETDNPEGGGTKEEPVAENEPLADQSEKTEDTSMEEIKETVKEQQEPAEEAMETEVPANDGKKEESKSKEEKDDSKEKSPEREPIPTHFFRVGWSMANCGLQLGEEKQSFGYDSTGKFVTASEFTDYGKTYGVGDVIGAFLSIVGDEVTMKFTVNGEVQDSSYTVEKSSFPENVSLFPHILSRNYAYEVNLGDKEEPWFPIPEELAGHQFLSKIEEKVSGPTRPENRSECETILMWGLPACGKSYWVAEHVNSNADKKYTVIGNKSLLEKMTISGEPLKSRYPGKWWHFIDKLQKSVNKLIWLAALRRRNYIIDQTNVYPSAQRRKLRPFEGFKRKAVIIVLGEEEQARRQVLQEAQDGKDVLDSTLLEMKAAMVLPEKCDWVDELIYAGVGEDEAKEIVKKYNTVGKEAGYGTENKFDRWRGRRDDYRGKNYRDRNYRQQRYDPRGDWHRGGARSWNRDRRDNRGPPNRDWRAGGGRDSRGGRDNRDSRDSRNNSGYGYGRNRSSGSRGPPPRDQSSSRNYQSSSRSSQNWSSGGSWVQSGGGGGSGGWNQPFGSSQNWGGSGSGQSQWKYSGGQGYGSYGNWYGNYGQYGQNWNQK